MVIAGWIMLALFALFMVGASATPKLMGMEAAKRPMETLGWPPQYTFAIGVGEVLFALLVLIPQMAVIGGILMTGLIGGAIASNLRSGSPLYTHTPFGVYLGCYMWLGILLRDEAVRRVVVGF